MVIGKVYYLILGLALCCLVVSVWNAWFYRLPTEYVPHFYVSQSKRRLFISLFHINEDRPRAHPVSCAMGIGIPSRG